MLVSEGTISRQDYFSTCDPCREIVPRMHCFSILDSALMYSVFMTIPDSVNNEIMSIHDRNVRYIQYNNSGNIIIYNQKNSTRKYQCSCHCGNHLQELHHITVVIVVVYHTAKPLIVLYPFGLPSRRGSRLR